MDLLDIVRVLRRRWVVALIAAGIGIALLVAATSAIEPDWDGRASVTLEETGIIVPVYINQHQVLVKALYLRPEIFGTVPMYFLTTNIGHG